MFTRQDDLKFILMKENTKDKNTNKIKKKYNLKICRTLYTQKLFEIV
jgi:hypothetical protein